ncbi:MAG: ComF family protein, partial [Bacteroidota bacterium]
LYMYTKKGRLQGIVKALKYKSQPMVGVDMGQVYGEKLKAAEMMRGVEALIPVPLHRSRLAQRGYNQSEKIAEGLTAELEIPIVTDCLVRSKKTATQTKKGREARYENMKESFEVQGTPPRSVALVDDVVTTGATLEACIQALMAHPEPPEKVFILALGMAKHD